MFVFRRINAKSIDTESAEVLTYSQLISDFLITIVINVSFLYAIMATAGRLLQLRVASTLPVIFITLISVISIGYFLAGLGLVFKRVEASFHIFQFAFALKWKLVV